MLDLVDQGDGEVGAADGGAAPLVGQQVAAMRSAAARGLPCTSSNPTGGG
ncbi:hypothetical protein [Blastococcus sp. VKM Ac-2987]|nr:hypothetical protein [Blastococcus sp. VKM Ac-2987]MCZ2858707.1 hypothetical protein [Blastococcus sp. VKM Ac-2987]